MVPYSPNNYKKILKSTVTQSHPVPGLIKEENVSILSHKVSAVGGFA